LAPIRVSRQIATLFTAWLQDQKNLKERFNVLVGNVNNQKERHRTGKTVDRLERITDFGDEEIDDKD